MKPVRHVIVLAAVLLGPPAFAEAEAPCNKYPQTEQGRCEQLWKQLNQEAADEVAQFGLKQLKRRQEGKITQEQHLKENMDFIKQSTDKRLKLLAEKMAQPPDPPAKPKPKPSERNRDSQERLQR